MCDVQPTEEILRLYEEFVNTILRIDEGFLLFYKDSMKLLTSKEVAEKLGVSARRVQQLAEAGRLPYQVFGGTLVFQESDLALVSDRKPGRPKKPDEGEAADLPAVTAAELKVGDVVKTAASVAARTKAKKAKLGTPAKSKTKTTAAGKGEAETKAATKRAAKKVRKQ